MRTYSAIHIYREERLWFYIASSILVTVFVAYAYFVSASVVHVVMRKEVDREIALMSSYISQLESEYIDAQHSMSADIAAMSGFVEAGDKIFIERTETSLVLSGNTDG